MKCECTDLHASRHRCSNSLVPVKRDGRPMNVCTECVLSGRDERLDKERQAWATVQMSAEDALAALQSVNEGVVDQAKLMDLIDKANVQQKLWAVEVVDGVLRGKS